MDGESLIDAFDEQVRRCASVDLPDELVELTEHVLRRLAPRGAWSGITWSGISSPDADAVIEEQLVRFAGLGREWEWKHYSWDEPGDLPARLLAHGFEADPPEALMFAELDALELDEEPLPGVEILEVRDASGAQRMASVHDAVFGEDSSGMVRQLLAALEKHESRAAAFIALVEERPVSAVRLEIYPDSEFASMWGGGTLEEFRKRGIMRALLARCARRARKLGARWLHADAMPTSEPILERLGFARLGTTTPYRQSGR